LKVIVKVIVKVMVKVTVCRSWVGEQDPVAKHVSKRIKSMTGLETRDAYQPKSAEAFQV
jgi:hypothetical protein